jgi:hypothetical protein
VRVFAKEEGSSKLKPLSMHWGAGVNSPAEWARPTDEILPAKSERHKDAVQTDFQPAQSGAGEVQSLRLSLSLSLSPSLSLSRRYRACAAKPTSCCTSTKVLALLVQKYKY